MAGINVQLNEALKPWLQQIRDQLTAPPVASPAAPAAPDPKPGEPADAQRRLDEFMAALARASGTRESAQNVGALAIQMQACLVIAKDLETKHKFDSIKLSDKKRQQLSFRRLRECVELAAVFYERLAYYQSTEGKKFLKGAAEATRHMTLDREKGDVPVRIHHFDERLDPLAGLRHWDYRNYYLAWAKKRAKAGVDPIEHIVEFLLDDNKYPTAIDDFLTGSIDERQRQARLHPTRDVAEFLDVHVLTHVAGDEKFSRPGQVRLWTFQVKIPGRAKRRDDFDKPTFDATFDSVWSPDAWLAETNETISLPTLRALNSSRTARPTGGVLSTDFTRGTLYAMRGPDTMRCYPADIKFHTALFESETTSAAGLLVANEGRVVAIDNRSGHYQPGYQQLRTAVQYLSTVGAFDADAFVSVHVGDSDALYFSPDGFLSAASRDMNFSTVARLVQQRAQQFNYQLPVANRLADLIPTALKDFPARTGGNRWDRMLANYYTGKDGLETIAKDFRDALRLAVPKEAKLLVGIKPGGHVSEALRILDKVRKGGAYCELPDLVNKLLTLTQPTGEQGQTAQIEANLRYRQIAGRLAALAPARSPF
jgi:hypothetical protein